ncbi:MAG: hypothetical protein A3C88_01405 [Candidatus Yanofskybacteria bacterium RIFCSPHIGHO2_02_FULL_50_12]|uniref:Uncharacterized protein n=1 Tax=Candidatus Yanofskybacteria bacterium RIFCSPHIGHO2_02_FULL_50_12 TaxID=1802685 RepID=A0A1F8FZ11_9BACT|nr:MAG: hypothetical protein A3C88_01405 [Candidatus Yanofskybacteria bacterium RIFCSPHIGHO2_02_FULL_50_12]
MEPGEPKITESGSENAVVRLRSQFERVSELMKKAEVIPDSHWNEEELRKAAEALTEVANFLEGNVGSEN